MSIQKAPEWPYRGYFGIFVELIQNISGSRSSRNWGEVPINGDDGQIGLCKRLLGSGQPPNFGFGAGAGQLFGLLKTTLGDSFTNTTVCDEEG
jgi:hypothetical protein